MQAQIIRNDKLPSYLLDTMLALALRMLGMMDGLTPIVDKNLYIIYCEEFNKSEYGNGNDIAYNDTKLLTKFIYDNVFSRTRGIIRDIEFLLKVGYLDSLMSFPTIVKDSLDDTMVANLTLNNAVDPIIRLKGSLLENNRLMCEYLSRTGGGRDTYLTPTDINVTSDDLFKFINITLERLDDLLVMGSRDDTVAEDVRTGYNVVVEYVKCLVYMVMYKDNNIAEMLKDNVIEAHLERVTNELIKYDPVRSFYRQSHISLASAICIYPGMTLSIPKNDTNCSTTTDTFQFLKMSTAYKYLHDQFIRIPIDKHRGKQQ